MILANPIIDRSKYPEVDWEVVDRILSFCKEQFAEGYKNVIITTESLEDNQGLWLAWRGLMMDVESNPNRYSENFRSNYEDLAILIGDSYINRVGPNTTGWCTSEWFRQHSEEYPNSFYVSYHEFIAPTPQIDLDALFDEVMMCTTEVL